MSAQLVVPTESSENILIIPGQSGIEETISSNTETIVKQVIRSNERMKGWGTNTSNLSMPMKTLFGALYMENSSPPSPMITIRERSVDRIRKKFHLYKSDGSILFDIDISSLAILDTPEGFTRIGVMLIQISTFLKNRAMISVDRASTVDRERDPILYSNTLRILKEAVKIGFPFIRVPGGIHMEDLKGIWSLAEKKDIKIILTNVVGGNETWTPPEQDKISHCSYYELVVSVDKMDDIERLLKLTDIINLFMKDNKVIIRVNGLFSPILNLLTPALGSSMFQYDMGPLDPEKDSDVLVRKDLLMKEMGLSEEFQKSKWSLRRYRLSLDTKINFIFGKLNDTTRTVVMFNGETRRRMKESIFIPYESDYNDFSRCIDILRNANSNGAIIDIPYKSLAINFVDELSEISEIVGSINLIKKDESGRLIGYNTEGQAVVDVLEKTNIDQPSRILIMGSGTTGRSAAASLHAAGYRVLLLNTGNKKLDRFAHKLGPGAGTISLDNVKHLKGKIEIIVNATPNGMIMDPQNPGMKLMVSDIARDLEPRVGVELSYRENWTPFLSSVESRGGLTISGVDFLMKKKELTYNILMGYHPNVGFMREVTREAGFL